MSAIIRFFHLSGDQHDKLDPDVHRADQTARALKIVVLCMLWYISSALSNTISKSLLRIFPFPQTLTIVQLGSVMLYLPLHMRFFGIKFQPLSRSQFVSKLGPLAVMRVVAMIMSAVSILKVPVSYAHTVKAIGPVSTVLMSMLLLREYPTFPIFLSLIPIVFGIMLATVTEIHFDMVGMLSALASTMIFSVQNIYSKKIMRQRVLDHSNLLFQSTRAAFIVILPFWLLTDGWTIYAADHVSSQHNPEFSWSAVFIRIWLESIFFFSQNITAFSVLYLVSPVSYSVANTTKRIVVITTSLFVFGNEVSFWNVVGMSIAIGGVALYNKAKFDAAKKKALYELPKTVKDGGTESYSPFMEYGDTKVLAAAERKLSLPRIGPSVPIDALEYGHMRTQNAQDSDLNSYVLSHGTHGQRHHLSNSYQPIAQSPERSL